MIQTVHEIQDPFDVKTPLGYGVAMFLFTGSINSNPSFLCKFYDTGELRVVDMRDCLAYGNPSAGEKLEPNTHKEFIKWAENFFVDVEWTDAIKKRLKFMINALDTRVVFKEGPPKLIVKHVTKFVRISEIPQDVPKQRLDEIAEKVCTLYGINLEDLKGKSRRKLFVDARFEFCMAARHSEHTLTDIGRYLNRDHTTVMHHLHQRNSGETGQDGEGKQDHGRSVGTPVESGFQSEIRRGEEAHQPAAEKLTNYASLLL
jgi:hypothetical protein